MAKTKNILVSDLRRGMNDSDPPTALLEGQCVSMENVEFHCSSREERSTIGTRRAGTDAISTPITAGNDVVAIHRNFPATDLGSVELTAVDYDGSSTINMRYKNTAWNSVTFTDAAETTNNSAYHFRLQSLHGKEFVAYNSAQNRLHVRDSGSTTLRRAGLAEPAAPTVAETGAGAFSGIRYYRVRYTVQAAGVTLRRSEPSDVTTYNPADFGSNGLAARITKPATISESETHWEVEASLDNSLFYRIATVVVGTTTYDDSTAFSTGYAVAGTLSEDSGDYSPLHSAKFLTADDDRMVIAGSWEDDSLSSRVAWTPVLNDPGVGNDERSPIDTDNFIDLDTYEGGSITDMSKTMNGYIFVFKQSHTYQLTRTGQRTRAYQAHAMSKKIGAIEGSVIEAVDQNGRPAVYFIDQQAGPCRIGDGGIQLCGLDIHKTWETVNKDATVVSRSVYYPDSQQIHWWIATGSSNFPDLCLVLHVRHTLQTSEGLRGGWVKFTGGRASAISTCMFSENIDAGVTRTTVLKPFIGKTDGTIHICDTGDDDNGTSFAASIVTGPVLINTLYQYGITNGGIVARAASVNMEVSAIRDFGVEESVPISVNLSPIGVEETVIISLDSFFMSYFYALQIRFQDPATPAGSWNLYMFEAEVTTQG